MSLKDGVRITLPNAYNITSYIGYTSIWEFTGSAFPKLLVAEPPAYPGLSGIDYLSIDAHDLLRIGTHVSEDNLDYSILSPSIWDLTSPYPEVKEIPATEYDRTVKPIDYSYWAVLEELTFGKAISLAKSKLISTYADNGWDISKVWYMDSDILNPLLSYSPPAYSYEPMPVDYRSINEYDALRFGNVITTTASKTDTPYVEQGFDFNTLWGIQAGFGFPMLLNKTKHTPISDPSSSTAWEIVMAKDSTEGNMYFEDAIWGPAYPPTPLEVKGGMPGTIVNHELPKKVSRVDISETEREYYIYIGAGVENPTNPSGYNPPQQLTTVSSVLHIDRSTDVVFYYIKINSPDYDYLVQVSSENPSVPYHLIVTQKNPGSIKLRLPNRQYGWFNLVPLTDPFSSPIRVKTSNGIMSIQSPDINESLFEIIETNPKPSIAFITNNINSPDNPELITAIEKLGYNLILISDATASSKKFGSFDKYDLIVIGRTSTKDYSSAIMSSRKPVILGYAMENAITMQWELGMVQGDAYHTDTTVNTTQYVMDNTHPITKLFTPGYSFNPYKSTSNNFVGVINNNNNGITGKPLIQSTNHPLGTGAISLSATITEFGQRKVYMGFLYKDLSAVTILLLGRAIKWAMGLDKELEYVDLNDTDGDGFSNAVEREALTDPYDPNDIPIDTDGDGIWDNLDPDKDNDGFTDEYEIEHGYDPLDPNDFPVDTDGDGIYDNIDPDDDNDGYPDTWEIENGTDPKDPNSFPSVPLPDIYSILEGPFSASLDISTSSRKFILNKDKMRLESTNKGIDSSTSESIFDLTFNKSGILEIHSGVSSEGNYDKFTLTFNGHVIRNDISGLVNYVDRINIAPGTYRLVLSYSKDSSASSNEDIGYITKLKFI